MVPRNELIHDGRFTHPIELVARASRQLQDFKLANMGGDANSRDHTATVQFWEKPLEGYFFKVNCDAAVDRINGRLGLGVIIRDYLGYVRAARSSTRTGFMEPTAAEALAMFHGARLCKDLDLQNVVLEGDAQVVISALQSGDITGSRWGHLVEDVHTSLQNCPNWKARHVRRECNTSAHGLAKGPFTMS